MGGSSTALRALVPALAIPCLFLHATYQPHFSVGVSGTSIDITLADLSVLAVVVLALSTARAEGVGALRPARWLVAGVAAFLLIALLWVALPRLRGEDYETVRHLISALKFAWYALLFPALALLLRTTEHVSVVLRAVVAWSAAATGWGFLQFLGVVSEFEGKRPGQREPSFVGIHDFAALSGAALTLGVASLVLADDRLLGRRWWRDLALASGALGVVLSGAMTGVAGVWLAFAVALLLVRAAGSLTVRRVMVVIVMATMVAAGAAVMRAGTIERFAEFLGLRERTEQTGVESYAQRTLLAYIGGRIWLGSPLLGVGWQASDDRWAYDPYLDDARKRFPDEPAEAFPSPERPWGVQMLYIQVLADLGLVGGAALLAIGIGAVRLGLRRSRGSPVALVGLCWLCVAAGVWAGVGLIAGIPVAALTWLALGLVSSDS
ncbi:MAG: O-antigen ligase family protein [Gaiella sp.]